MASTTNLLITHIESSQAQKEVTANEAFNALDTAIAGRLALSTTGGTTTLTADEARNAILDVSGALTSNAVIVVPARSKLYAVRNATSGAFTLTVKTASGTGVVVTQGESAIVFCDGTNVVTAQDVDVGNVLGFDRDPARTTGLTFAYKSGRVRNDNAVTSVAAGTLALTDAATNYIEVAGNGAISANTTGFTAGRIPLWTATTSAGAISGYSDQRAALGIGGGGTQTSINGLALIWVSGSAVDVSTGSAWVPSLNRVLEVSTKISLTGLSFTASTWYHLYLYDNAGTPAVEISTTAPDPAYAGSARTKAADTSRRYLGSVKSDDATTPALVPFQMSGQRWLWRRGTGTLFRALSGGTATTPTLVSLSAGVPLTASIAFVRAFNTASAGIVWFGHGDDPLDDTSNNYLALDAKANAFVDHPINGSQQIKYYQTSGGTGYCDIYGFLLER